MNLDMRSTKKTQEGDPQDDDSYLGYSVATGEFNGDGDKMDVAVGMPRGANLTGKVTFFFLNSKPPVIFLYFYLVLVYFTH